MAIISLVIEDTETGEVNTKWVSDKPLPENIEKLTPAQAFAIELKKSLDLLI